MKSIMHDKREHSCYLCRKLHGDDSWKQDLQEHHVMFGRGRRRLSEKYGLKIYLCVYHHIYDGGPEAVHRNDVVRRGTERDAQRVFEKRYGHSLWMQEFGKNYMDDGTGADVKEERT